MLAGMWHWISLGTSSRSGATYRDDATVRPLREGSERPHPWADRRVGLAAGLHLESLVSGAHAAGVFLSFMPERERVERLLSDLWQAGPARQE